MKKFNRNYLLGLVRQVLKKDFTIGIDIGSSSVKLVQFTKDSGVARVVLTKLKEITPTQDKKSNEAEIVLALKYLVKDISVKEAKVFVNINCSQTAVKKVIAPYMPENELRQGLLLEAKNYFPFPIEESILDFEVLKEIDDKGIKKYEVAVSVSPRQTINNYLSLLKQAGIKPVAFVPAVCALQRVYEKDYYNGKQSVCCIDIGYFFTELAIYKGGNLEFSRKLPVCGSDFTNAMTGMLVSDRGKTQLSLEEAEAIKKEIGIPAGGESKIIHDKIFTAQVLSMIRMPLDQLINEIERCFDYYREETGIGKVDLLVLFGGGGRLRGLKEKLSNELGIAVKLGDNMELAVGAALSDARKINLLPSEIKEKTKRIFKRSGIEAMVVGVIIALALIYIGMGIQLNTFQKKIFVAKMELSSLRPQLKQIEVENLLINEPYWEDVFKELSNVIPADIYLTELNMENKIMRIRGIVISKEAEASLSHFILTLKRGMFNNVKLVTSKKIEEKLVNEFELTCGVE